MRIIANITAAALMRTINIIEARSNAAFGA
jgi:hypothetical protein